MANFQRALDAVRNADGSPPPWAIAMINGAIDQLWARIRASPDSYIMNADEFALFNYFRARFTSPADEPIARRAAARYWNHHTGVNGR